MVDVFISYKREERARCASFAERLRGLGLNVWFDAKLESGVSFDTEIEEKVTAAKAVLVLWSPASVKSTWVRNEASIGAQRDALVSVEIAPCTRPIQFTNTHTESLHDANFSETNPAWAAILRRLARLTGKAHLTMLADALDQSSGSTGRTKGVGFLTAGVILVGGLALGSIGGFFAGLQQTPAGAPPLPVAPIQQPSVADLVGRWGGGAFACGKLELALGLDAQGLRVAVGNQAATVEPVSASDANGWFRSDNPASPNFWKRDGEGLLWRVGAVTDAASESRLNRCAVVANPQAAAVEGAGP